MGIFDGLFGGGDSGFDDARKANLRNRALYNSLILPDYKEWVPEQYTNESANYELTKEDPMLRNQQMEILSKLSNLSNNGLSAEDEAGYMKARDVGNQMARAGTQAAIQDAQNRGVAGGGLEFAMREIANQGGAQRAQESALQQAADSARQRAMYTQALGNATSQMRGDDLRANAANTDIINRFNQYNTQARNQTNQANAQLKNDAFQYNQGLKDKRYQNELGRTDRIAGFNNKDAEIGAAEAEQRRRRGSAVGGLVGAGIGALAGGGAGAQVGYGIGSSL